MNTLHRRTLLAATLPSLPFLAAATPPPPNPAAAAASAAPSGFTPAGEYPAEALKIGGRPRVYRLSVSRSVARMKDITLVIALHGMGKDNKDVFAKFSGLSDSAERNDFAVAFGQSEEQGWGMKGADLDADLAYVDAVYDALLARLPVAPGRVHLVGFSSGARLALRAAVARPGRFASLTVHSPLLPIPSGKLPPLLWIHGEKDPLVPIATARQAAKSIRRVEFVPAPDVGHQWARGRVFTDRIWAFQSLNNPSTNPSTSPSATPKGKG